MTPQLEFNKIAEDNQREAAEYLSTSELEAIISQILHFVWSKFWGAL